LLVIFKQCWPTSKHKWPRIFPGGAKNGKIRFTHSKLRKQPCLLKI